MTASPALNLRAALASIAVAVFLVGAKAWAAWSTGSTAMLGSLADSGLDLVASLSTLAGVWIAAQPADEDHRFGHGKAEAIAAMVQVVLISISAFGLTVRAVQQWLGGGRTAAAEEGITVSLVAIAATVLLLAYQRRVIGRTGSVAIAADHVHYQSDLLLNLAVIAALALDQYAGIAGADPLLALAIAAWLGWGAWGASRAAIEQLMDQEWPEEKRQRFVEIAARHPELERLHDLRTRTSGNRDFVQFHVDLPGSMTVAESHAIIDRVERELCRHFPALELLIHIDPAGHVDAPDNPLVEQDEFDKFGEQP
jgi:ferrous-iron efflux pump FieF